MLSARGFRSAAGPLKTFISCTGSTAIVVGVDKSLAALKAEAEGITFSSSCSKPGCLITVCGSTHLVLWHSSFTGEYAHTGRLQVAGSACG